MDARVEGLVAEARSGDLTRRQVVERAAALGVSAAAVLALLDGPSLAAAADRGVRPKKWQKGKGWGWVWGPDDELGALNELSPKLARKALAHARGHVYDLGLEYDRRSFKFSGHANGEITTYRSPAGLLLQRDRPEVIDPSSNSTHTTWASCLNTISDNVATQIDGLGHIYEGDPPHAYNGFKASEIVGDYGLVKLDVTTIPPVVAPATLIDVAGHLGRETLPGHYAIGPDLLRAALRRQQVDIDPLDVVLIRTGTAGVWLRGDGVGANNGRGRGGRLRRHDGVGRALAGRGEGRADDRVRHQRASRSPRRPSSYRTGRASTPSTSTCSCARECTSSSC